MKEVLFIAIQEFKRAKSAYRVLHNRTTIEDYASSYIALRHAMLNN